MKMIDLTLPTPHENLAYDEALLDQGETGGGEETLRFWEPRDYFVVVGYSNLIEREVNVEACRQAGIPILRRSSGGGAVLLGPGCLVYSLVLKTGGRPDLRTIAGTNRLVLERHRRALEGLLHRKVHVQGHTDLTLGPLKFSGNAQRRKRIALLVHGTFLLNFDWEVMRKALPPPSRQPAYREKRNHAEFLVNLEISSERVKEALRDTWRIE